MSTSLVAKVLRPVAPAPLVIDLGDQAPLVRLGANAIELASSMTVDSAEMAAEAQAEIAEWARESADIEAWRKTITGPIDAAKRSVMDFVRPATERLEEASTILKRKCAAWQQAERERVERERREQERVAAEQRAKAEADARAAQERAQAEARAAEEAVRKARESTDAAERERHEAEAYKRALAAEREREEAATSAAMAQVIVASPSHEPAKVAGLRFTENEDPEVTDLLPLIAWVASNPSFAHLLKPDLQAIKAARKAMKDGFNPAGVRFTKTLSTARGARAA